MVDMRGLLSSQGELFLLMALGFFFKRRKLLDDGFQRGLMDLVLDLVLPCNIVNSFCITFNMDILHQTFMILLVSLGIQGGCWILSKLLFLRVSRDRAAVLRYGALCSNASLLGAPVAESIFGGQGLLLSSVYLIPQRIVMWTAGVTLFDPAGGKGAWKRVLRNPCIVAVAVGMVLLLTQWQLPAMLGDAIRAVSNCNTALALFLIGMIMAGIHLSDFVDPMVLYFTVIRLVLIPLLVMVVCRLCGVSELITNVSVVLAAMPAGSTTAILAAKYGGNAEFAASCLAVTTILSVPAIPLWCMVLQF